MGAGSRRKGAVGEREFARLLEDHGFEARRDGRLDDDLDHNVPGYHFEIKRRESLALPEWTRQAERDAGDRVAVVAYRRSREPWRVSLEAKELLRLLAIEQALREFLDSTEDEIDAWLGLGALKAALDGPPEG